MAHSALVCFYRTARPSRSGGYQNWRGGPTSADNAASSGSPIQHDRGRLLPKVLAPTLVLHSRATLPCLRRRPTWRRLVRRAKFVPLDSDNHVLLETEPAWPTFIHELNSFLQGGSALAITHAGKLYLRSSALGREPPVASKAVASSGPSAGFT